MGLNRAPHSAARPLGSTHLCVQITDELAGAGVPHSVAARKAVQDYVNKLLHAGGCSTSDLRQQRQAGWGGGGCGGDAAPGVRLQLVRAAWTAGSLPALLAGRWLCARVSD